MLDYRRHLDLQVLPRVVRLQFHGWSPLNHRTERVGVSGVNRHGPVDEARCPDRSECPEVLVSDLAGLPGHYRGSVVSF